MNTQEKLAVAVAVLSFLAGASAQLSDVFAPLGAYAPILVTEITTLCGLAGGILAIILKAKSSTEAQVRAVVSQGDDPDVQRALVLRVADYPGVTKIVTNPQARPTLQALANDPAVDKVEPAPPPSRK